MALDIETLRDYCISKKGVTEEFPFDTDTLVFKVLGKAFLFTSLSRKPLRFSVKCDPELAIELREKYEDVTGAYHMNKKHWNSVEAEGRVPRKEMVEMIDHSYNLVVKGLTKNLREKLNKAK